MTDFLLIVSLISSMQQKRETYMTTQLIDTLAGAPRETHAQSDGQKLTIGDGFVAQSYQHTDFQGLMDPLIMVDHFVATKPTFGPHAHAGLSAVTVMFEDSEGAFHNRDSLGNDLELAPGDLYWFKAARGALHDEAPRPDARTHALQVFVNLPAENRHDAPFAFHLPAKDIPKLAGDRSTARLILGEGNGVTGRVAPDVPLTLLDIYMQAGRSVYAQRQQRPTRLDLGHYWHLHRDLERRVCQSETWQSHRMCRCLRHLIYLRRGRPCRPVSGASLAPSLCSTGAVRDGQSSRA
jgi:hypothetical protein